MKPWEMMQRFGAVASASGGGASILANLTSYWDMNESGGTRADAIGTNHLLVSGTVTTGDGLGGSGDIAAAFAGGGSLYCDSNTSLNVPSGGGDHCLFGWFNPSAVSGSARGVVGKTDAMGNTTLEYRVEIISSGRLTASNGGSTYYTATGDVLAANTWYFCVMWRDSADGKVRLQVNDGTIYVSGATSNPPITSTRLCFGRYNNAYFGFGGRIQRWGWMKGAILTPEQRTWLYNGGAGRTFAEITSAG